MNSTVTVIIVNLMSFHVFFAQRGTRSLSHNRHFEKVVRQMRWKTETPATIGNQVASYCSFVCLFVCLFVNIVLLEYRLACFVMDPISFFL